MEKLQNMCHPCHGGRTLRRINNLSHNSLQTRITGDGFVCRVPNYGTTPSARPETSCCHALQVRAGRCGLPHSKQPVASGALFYIRIGVMGYMGTAANLLIGQSMAVHFARPLQIGYISSKILKIDNVLVHNQLNNFEIENFGAQQPS